MATFKGDIFPQVFLFLGLITLLNISILTLIPYRALTQLISWDAFDVFAAVCSYSIFVVCLKVYNEQIRDLLANAGPLAVREDSSKGVVVQGLTLHKVSSSMYHTHSHITT